MPSETLTNIERMLMLNPLLSELGWAFQAAGFAVAMITAGLCLFVAQQIASDPMRIAPWCYLRRFGLAVMSVLLTAHAWRYTGHEPTLISLVATCGLLCYMVGTACGRTMDGHQKTPRRNRATSPGVVKAS